MDAFSMGFPELLLVVLLALVVVSGASLPPPFWRQLRAHLGQLGDELDRRFDRERWVRRIPVYSAETVRAKEAEFIRDRLPRKAPPARYVLLLVLVGVLVWALTR